MWAIGRWALPQNGMGGANWGSLAWGGAIGGWPASLTPDSSRGVIRSEDGWGEACRPIGVMWGPLEARPAGRRVYERLAG